MKLFFVLLWVLASELAATPSLTVNVAGCTPITIIIDPGFDPAACAWSIKGAIPAVGVSPKSYTARHLDTQVVCLAQGTYTFQPNRRWWDGSFQVNNGDLVLAGPLDAGQTASFTVGATSSSAKSNTGVVRITSDGTLHKPFCSFIETCTWDAPTQQSCAESLCKASGFDAGMFVSSNGDLCTTDSINDKIWAYLVDGQTMVHGLRFFETAITADCGVAPSPSPMPSPSPEASTSLSPAVCLTDPKHSTDKVVLLKQYASSSRVGGTVTVSWDGHTMTVKFSSTTQPFSQVFLYGSQTQPSSIYDYTKKTSSNLGQMEVSITLTAAQLGITCTGQALHDVWVMARVAFSRETTLSWGFNSHDFYFQVPLSCNCQVTCFTDPKQSSNEVATLLRWASSSLVGGSMTVSWDGRVMTLKFSSTTQPFSQVWLYGSQTQPSSLYDYTKKTSSNLGQMEVSITLTAAELGVHCAAQELSYAWISAHMTFAGQTTVFWAFDGADWQLWAQLWCNCQDTAAAKFVPTVHLPMEARTSTKASSAPARAALGTVVGIALVLVAAAIVSRRRRMCTLGTEEDSTLLSEACI